MPWAPHPDLCPCHAGAWQSLLEHAATEFGLDTQTLVRQLPDGMEIEGLMPRLLALVNQGRGQVELLEGAVAAADTDLGVMIRERHGLRQRAATLSSPMNN